jgi:hypothetical protein
VRCLVAGAGSAMGRQRAGAAADVEVGFTGADGTLRREPLSGCWKVAFERVAAVRGFALFRGQRNRPGLRWFATTGEHVGHESWLERPVNRTSPGQATFPVLSRNH